MCAAGRAYARFRPRASPRSAYCRRLPCRATHRAWARSEVSRTTHTSSPGDATYGQLYFFSRRRIVSLRNIGRRRFAACANSHGNDTSIRSASSSTSMLADAVCPRARIQKCKVSPCQFCCSIAMTPPSWPFERAKPSLRRRLASIFPSRWLTVTVTLLLTRSGADWVCTTERAPSKTCSRALPDEKCFRPRP